MPADVTHSPFYLNYIHSPAWMNRKAMYYRSHPHRCAACGNPRVDLHHVTYDRLGHEDPADLIPLCEYHHGLVHEVRDRFPVDLAEATQYVTAHTRAAYARQRPPVRPAQRKPRLRTRVRSFLTGPSRPHL